MSPHVKRPVSRLHRASDHRSGGQYVISFDFYLSIPGDKPNKIVLDSTDRLAETDEDDNVFELLSAPDEYPESCDREAGAPTLS